MKNSFSKSSLQSSLNVSGPKRELWIAYLGCLIGSTLLILGVQLYQDASSFLAKSNGPKNYFTMNKKVEGGALINLGKNDRIFTSDELEKIKTLNGVNKVGGFVRNQFPLTLYIWPTGTVGLGAAAKTDLFFESIPDEFLDFIPRDWHWSENSETVPIMVPKFYLDLWNFGLAPSRIEYPSLSTKAATGMPIELFIGQKREAKLNGRFVAFSKRINSVLVPENFLEWANKKFGGPKADDYFFLWKNGAIEGPPVTRSILASLQDEPDFKNWETSPIHSPAKRIPALQALTEKKKKKKTGPSRIILEIEDNPSSSLLSYIQQNGLEINREFPEQDIIKKVTLVIFLGIATIGALLSLLSIATFATSFRLVVAQASEETQNLLLLGFSHNQVANVIFTRFLALFLFILGVSVITGYGIKSLLLSLANKNGIVLNPGLSFQTIVCILLYGLIYILINRIVIKNSVYKLLD